MSVQMDERFGTATEEEIRSVQDHLQSALPADYVDFLLQHNGGAPTPDEIDVPGWWGKVAVVDYFFAVNASQKLDNVLGVREFYRGRIPDSLLAIATDPSGNLFCLGLDQDRLGRVFLWDHENELDEDGMSRQDFSNVYEVAPSIGDMLSSLKDLTD